MLLRTRNTGLTLELLKTEFQALSLIHRITTCNLTDPRMVSYIKVWDALLYTITFLIFSKTKTKNKTFPGHDGLKSIPQQMLITSMLELGTEKRMPPHRWWKHSWKSIKKQKISHAVNANISPATESLHNPGYSDTLNNKTGGGKAFNLWARWNFVAHNNLKHTEKSILSLPWIWELKILEIACK